MALPAGLAIIIVLVTLKQIETSLIIKRYTVDLEIIFKENDYINSNILIIYNTLKEMNIRIRNIKKVEEKNMFICSLIVPKQFNTFDLISNISCNNFINCININS